MIRLIPIAVLLLLFISCKKQDENDPREADESSTFISAVDISSYPEIAETNPTFFDLDGNQNDFLTILKDNGINTIRLRLWVNPANEHSGFQEVAQFSETLRNMGFKIWLTLHYSDTWADPGNQETPAQWQDLDMETLKDSVYRYTKRVVLDIQPEYIQIGNEINSGMLHPLGNIQTENQNFLDLVREGCLAVREHADDTQIILHFAGIEGADWFFNQVSDIDYDIIGLSYYPIFHGKSLDDLASIMQSLGETYDKSVILAETSYPFTLEWNDWTNNVVGLDEQLILPQYPATSEGQREFMKEIVSISTQTPNGIGFSYWGAELIAWKGNEATDASSWENQALFDFDNKALPLLREFNVE